jgi:hypothetical protein
VTTLASPGGLALAGTGVSLVVSVSSVLGSPSVNGSVVVSDGGSALATVPVVNGSAALSENLTAVGVQQLSACFVAEQDFNASCSAPLVFTALSYYTLQQDSPTGVASVSNPFVDRVSVIPALGFTGTVQLACAVPQGTCKVSPVSVTFTNGGATQSATVTYTPSVAMASMSFILALLFGCFGITQRRRLGAKRIGVAAAAGVLMVSLAGCHALSYPIDSSTTTTMTVTASSGQFSQAVTADITVAQ